jgi:hypothetical protein
MMKYLVRSKPRMVNYTCVDMVFGLVARRSNWHVKAAADPSFNSVGDDDISLGQHFLIPTHMLFVV